MLFGVNVNSRINLFAVLLLVCSSNASASVAPPSSNGVIVVSGNISVPTCELDANSTKFNDSIQLSDIFVSDIENVMVGTEITKAAKSFEFKLVCTGSAHPKLRFSYEKEEVPAGSKLSDQLIKTDGSGSGISIGLSKSVSGSSGFVMVDSGEKISMDDEKIDDSGQYSYSLVMIAHAVRNAKVPRIGEVKATANVIVDEP
ncbi:fimbrial protein [Salmonella enterica subsp. enterica serovar Javiana]|nr:type 1 fimbrial protein [Salmonella enterica subsp. enterica serovar Javiana]EBV2938577.1 type 1 fimbrial protein [Salmonella enterica subsp. enterica serovar Javiana]EEE6990761.1 fimbrial protein [Salmonella enterica subsp. enterica serovar Javiana]